MKVMRKKDRIALFEQLWSEVFNPAYCEHIRELLDERGFFDAPASTKYHGNYKGGLFDHSLEVTNALLELTKRLNLHWERQESPYIVGMLHDLCKCDQYRELPDGGFDYQSNLPLTGHGDKSVIIAQQIMDLTEEEILCIRWHMGAYDDKSVWNNLGAAIEQYPNVLYTHTADMVASRVRGI